MEDPSFELSHAVSSHWIPTSFSESSLDILQITEAFGQPALLSESLTLDSLSSIGSNVPPMSPRFTQPPTRLVNLGHDLKLFPLFLGNQAEDTSPDAPANADDSVNVTTPTSPRLDALFKEDLYINMWAVSYGPFLKILFETT